VIFGLSMLERSASSPASSAPQRPRLASTRHSGRESPKRCAWRLGGPGSPRATAPPGEKERDLQHQGCLGPARSAHGP
jgi:hypothetical protein